jgi:hypothetical protein
MLTASPPNMPNKKIAITRAFILYAIFPAIAPNTRHPNGRILW